MLKDLIIKIIGEHRHSYWSKCVCGEQCIQDKEQAYEPQIHAHLAEKIVEVLEDIPARMEAVRTLHQPYLLDDDEFFCPECCVQFFEGDTCRTMKALEGK